MFILQYIGFSTLEFKGHISEASFHLLLSDLQLDDSDKKLIVWICCLNCMVEDSNHSAIMSVVVVGWFTFEHVMHHNDLVGYIVEDVELLPFA